MSSHGTYTVPTHVRIDPPRGVAIDMGFINQRLFERANSAWRNDYRVGDPVVNEDEHGKWVDVVVVYTGVNAAITTVRSGLVDWFGPGYRVRCMRLDHLKTPQL